MSFRRVTSLKTRIKHPPSSSRLCQMYFLINRFLVRFPPDCKYKQNTECIISYRQSILQNVQSIEEIECAINCGSLEQLIYQAERELSLMKTILPYKPWEPLVSTPPEHQWKWPMVPE